MVEISVIIPVYKCRDCLKELHSRLIATLQGITLKYEIIFVDDACPDASWDVISQLARNDKKVKGIRLSRNFGQHAAITAGLNHCVGECAVIMDCDLQDPPELIPDFYGKLQQGYDVVLGKRMRKSQSIFRKLSAKFYFKLTSIVSHQTMNPEYGSFSAISKKVINAYLRFNDQNRHYIFILIWLGFNATEISYHQNARFAGESSYSIAHLIRHAVDGVLFQDTKFLQWVIFLGFLVSLSGVLSAVYLIYIYFKYSSVEGWTSLSVLVIFLGGVNISILGVLGIYIGKVFEQTKSRPLFVVAKKTGE